MARLKYGAFKLMTPEEQHEHSLMLHRRWASKNRETVRNQFKKYYDIWKSTKPFECICVNCNHKFNAVRPYYKLCNKCQENIHINAKEKQEALEKKRADYRDKIQQILEMARTGAPQKQIADKFGYTQCAISAIMRRNGIHRKKEIFERVKKKKRLTKK